MEMKPINTESPSQLQWTEERRKQIEPRPPAGQAARPDPPPVMAFSLHVSKPSDGKASGIT